MSMSLPIGAIESKVWLDDAACANLDTNLFFVQAGHVINDDILNICRGCPVRVECVKHAYDERLNITGGYFGGLSPGQRRTMSLKKALEFCASDTASSKGPEEDPDIVVYT